MKSNQTSALHDDTSISHKAAKTKQWAKAIAFGVVFFTCYNNLQTPQESLIELSSHVDVTIQDADTNEAAAANASTISTEETHLLSFDVSFSFEIDAGEYVNKAIHYVLEKIN